MSDALRSRVENVLSSMAGLMSQRPAGTPDQACSGAGSILPQPSGRPQSLSMPDNPVSPEALAKEIDGKINSAYFWESDEIAVDYVKKLSAKQLSDLPNATKLQLLNSIDSGYVSDEEKWVLGKLDKAVPTSYGKQIKIDGEVPFRVGTIEALDRLNATPTGKALLSAREASGKTVTIQHTPDQNGYAKPLSTGAYLKSDGTPGSGSDSIISFNPNFVPPGLSNEVVLGHELIHTDHQANGTVPSARDENGRHMDEEHQTVGLPPYAETGLTENSIRADLKLPKRTEY